MIKFSTALLGMALSLPSIAVAQALASPGRFEKTACPPEVASGERIDCGLLVVPENRKAPASRTIRLPVIIMRSRAAVPASDPVLFLAGGPGNSNTGGPRSGKGNPFLDMRDQVLLEPRGARRAEPALDCPEINAAQDRIAAGPLMGQAGRVSAAKACRARLIAAGIDLNGYTSAETADDIEDLRTALGYGKLNLYAFSYGTRLALTFIRRHPDSVRSLVLDSVLPPEVNYDEAASANVRRALHAVFGGCAADPACGRAYPDLSRRFTTLIAKADHEPLVIPSTEPGGATVRADGRLIAAAIAAALEDPATIPAIPRVIGEASAGRYEALAPLIARSQAPSTFTWGLRLSVWCAEEAPFEGSGPGRGPGRAVAGPGRPGYAHRPTGGLSRLERRRCARGREPGGEVRRPRPDLRWRVRSRHAARLGPPAARQHAQRHRRRDARPLARSVLQRLRRQDGRHLHHRPRHASPRRLRLEAIGPGLRRRPGEMKG